MGPRIREDTRGRGSVEEGEGVRVRDSLLLEGLGGILLF